MTAPTDEQEKALQKLADQAQELGMGYEPPIDTCREALAELVRLQDEPWPSREPESTLHKRVNERLKKESDAWAAARAALRQRESLLRPATAAPVGTRPAGRGMPPADDPRK